MLETGFEQYDPNYTEAIKQYKVAASMKNTDGIFNLALAYQNGVGIKANDIKAIDLLKQAANQGHGEAQDYLITLGIVRDKSEFIRAKDLEPEYSDDEFEEEEEESEDEQPDDTFQRVHTKAQNRNIDPREQIEVRNLFVNI